MGKRSSFERNPRDFYPTPYEAVLPLLPHLPTGIRFGEPCAGDGRLIRHLERHGHECLWASDVFPQAEGVEQRDVLFFNDELPACDMLITNPPWQRDILHRMIEIFRMNAPTWLLFDADWWFTGQADPYKRFCRKVVPVGRVSWLGNGTSGMDNCAWYLFDVSEGATVLV